MERVREFFQSTGGKILAGCLIIGALVVAGFAIHANLGGSDAAAVAGERTFICAKTGKPFRLKIAVGMEIPVKSPHSGEATGYIAELCYWTKDGGLLTEPTPVLMNKYAGKPEPTFCEVCGRLVVDHNPQPREGAKPPPTQTEYATRKTRTDNQTP